MSRALLIASTALLGAAGACDASPAPPYGGFPPPPDASVDSGAGESAPSPVDAKDGGRD